MIEVISDNPTSPPSDIVLPSGPIPLNEDGSIKDEYFVEDWRDLRLYGIPNVTNSPFVMFADATLILNDTQRDIDRQITAYPSPNLENWIINTTGILETADWKADESLSILSASVDYYIAKAIAVLNGSSAAHDAVSRTANDILNSGASATEGEIIGIRDYSVMWASVTLEAASQVSDFRNALASKMEVLSKFITSSANLSALARDALWQVIEDLKRRIAELETRISSLLSQIEDLKNSKTSLLDLIEDTIGDALNKIGEVIPDLPDPKDFDFEKYVKYALWGLGIFLGIKVVGLFR